MSLASASPSFLAALETPCKGFFSAFSLCSYAKMASKKAKGPGSMAQKVKKIMQADEDTGKLAQGAPVVLGEHKLL